MSALPLYIAVCRNLLELNSLDDPKNELWDEAVRKLRRLRHVLQCRVCKVIRKDPYGASGCNHITCGDCKDSKKGYFSGCRYCKIPAELKPDKQTIAVLKCYAKVCEILKSYHATGADSLRKSRIEKIWDIICEGICLFKTQVDVGNVAGQKGDETGEFNEQRPPDAQEKQHIEDDVDHVPNENNVLQDGGSFQDGRHTQDGVTLGLESEESERLPFQKEELSADQTGLVTDLNGISGIKKESLEEKVVPKLYAKKEKNSKYFKLVSKFSENEAKSEFRPLLKECLEIRGKIVGEAKNGFVHEKEFEKSSHNGTQPLKHGKRKLSPCRSSESEKTLAACTKEKIIKSDAEHDLHRNYESPVCEIKDQDPSKFYHSKRNTPAKTNTALHRNENTVVAKQEDVCVKEEGQVGNARGKSENGHRQYSFLRKNKYKCMCGNTSGIKHFSDICNHKRCVCFAAGVPCVSCKCKFCSNPHKSHYNVKWSTIGIESDIQAVKVEHSAEDSM